MLGLPYNGRKNKGEKKYLRERRVERVFRSCDTNGSSSSAAGETDAWRRKDGKRKASGTDVLRFAQ